MGLFANGAIGSSGGALHVGCLFCNVGCRKHSGHVGTGSRWASSVSWWRSTASRGRIRQRRYVAKRAGRLPVCFAALYGVHDVLLYAEEPMYEEWPNAMGIYRHLRERETPIAPPSSSRCAFRARPMSGCALSCAVARRSVQPSQMSASEASSAQLGCLVQRPVPRPTGHAPRQYSPRSAQDASAPISRCGC